MHVDLCGYADRHLPGVLLTDDDDPNLVRVLAVHSIHPPVCSTAPKHRAIRENADLAHGLSRPGNNSEGLDEGSLLEISPKRTAVDMQDFLMVFEFAHNPFEYSPQ